MQGVNPMPSYIISAVAPNGKKLTQEVEAPNGGDAVRILRERGYRDVKLEREEIDAFTRKQFEAVTNEKPINNLVSAKDYVSLSQNKTRGRLGLLFTYIRMFYKTLWPVVVALTAIIAVRRLYYGSWDGWDLLLIVGLVAPIGGAVWGAYFSPAAKYQELLEAICWYRWQEALLILPSLHGRMPKFQLAVHEAQALAGLGRLDAALAVLARYADGKDKDVTEWMYWGRLGDVYFPAGRPDLILQSQRKALALEPKNACSLIDLAGSLVRFEHDVQGAKSLLAQVDPDEVTDLIRAFLDTVEGQIALEEQDHRRALECFQRSLKEREKWAVMPPMAQGIDALHGYVALAYAGLGEMETARRHFKRAEPRLRIFAIKDTLERCQRVLGKYAE